MSADSVQGPGDDGPPEGGSPADVPPEMGPPADPPAPGGSDLRGQLTAMRREIEAHRRELEVRLSELHQQAEHPASALSADAVARERAVSVTPHDPPGAPAAELAALRAELEQARDAARKHVDRNAQAGVVLDDLQRVVDDLGSELSDLERRRATMQAQTHALARQLAERTEEATRATEQARVLSHGLERVREDERGRAAALRQAEVSLRRLRASAADLGAGLEREREEHAQVAAALRSQLKDQRRGQVAAAQQDRGRAAADPFTPVTGLVQATIVAREVGVEICDRLRGLERSVDGLGDRLRATAEHLSGLGRLPSTPVAPDGAKVLPDEPRLPERRAAERARTLELERTARALIGTARELRGQYEHELAGLERELGARLEREREAHARELHAVHERVEQLRRELGAADRLLRSELAVEQRARSDAEQQLATERERARARERVRLELERALEVERQRAAQDRKVAGDLSRELAQRVASERQAHEELDRLRAQPEGDPVQAVPPSQADDPVQAVPPPQADDPVQAVPPPQADDRVQAVPPPQAGPTQAHSPSDPPAGDQPPGEQSAQSPGPPVSDAPADREAVLETPDSPEPREPPTHRSAAPSAQQSGARAGGGFPGASAEVGAPAHTVSLTRSPTGSTNGAQDAGRLGSQRNGAWEGEISAARLGDGRGSVAIRPSTAPSPASRAWGADAGAAGEGGGSCPGTDLADALTRAVKRLRDRADAAQAPPRGSAHGALRRPREHAGGTGAPGSAPARWPPSLRGPSRLEALRGRPRAAEAAATPTSPVSPAVIPGTVVLSAPSSTAAPATASHPWLAGAIRRLASGGDGALAGALLAELLPAQGLRCRRPLSFEIDIQGSGAFIVAADGCGRAEVVARPPQTESTAGLRLRGTPWQLAELLAGGSGRELPGVQVQGRRRLLRRLLRSRRLPVSLAELAAAGVCPWPGLLLAALAQGVPGAWTHGEDFTVVFAIGPDPDRDPDRDANAGAVRVCVRPTRGIEVVDGPSGDEPTATLHVRERVLFDLLGGIVRGGPAQALVSGDPQVVHRLLAWFHRVQGLVA